MGASNWLSRNIVVLKMIGSGIMHHWKDCFDKKVVNHPIDIVVTWVDGNDEAWQASKNEYLSKEHPDRNKGNASCRYRDWDFFRYWFRSIEQYAPWVNKVFFVTCGHVPEWLNINSPKLCVVRHDEFIPKEYLPTFSSIPIELNMHRIPGLSENFVYFNDDVFLARPCQPTDFFVRGKPVACPVPVPVFLSANQVSLHIMFSTYSEINQKNDIAKAIRKNASRWFSPENWRQYRRIISAYKNSSIPGMYFSHMGVPFLKSKMQDVWEKYDSIAETCKHRFRTPMDIMHYVFTAENLLNGEFYPCSEKHFGTILDMRNFEMIESIFRKQNRTMVCFNDSGEYSDELVEEINGRISAILKECFPNKSCFEN